jgi:glycosyltransferase involved in cell wall biosynthesis
MKISIITVCYNSAATIRDTIESVLVQDYPNVEYIIVDGASKDDTLSIVQSYGSRIAKVISEKDKGIYDAMNKGVHAATGDLIGILNSDDFYADSRVLSDVAAAISASGADALYADLVYVDPADTARVVRTWISGPYRKQHFRRGWMPPHPTFFLRRACYERHGLYRTDLRLAADYELMLRMLFVNDVSVAYLPRVTIRMRAGGAGNVSLRQRLRANREDRKAWRLNHLKPHPLLALMKPLRKIGQFLRK